MEILEVHIKLNNGNTLVIPTKHVEKDRIVFNEILENKDCISRVSYNGTTVKGNKLRDWVRRIPHTDKFIKAEYFYKFNNLILNLICYGNCLQLLFLNNDITTYDDTIYLVAKSEFDTNAQILKLSSYINIVKMTHNYETYGIGSTYRKAYGLAFETTTIGRLQLTI